MNDKHKLGFSKPYLLFCSCPEQTGTVIVNQIYFGIWYYPETMYIASISNYL